MKALATRAVAPAGGGSSARKVNQLSTTASLSAAWVHGEDDCASTRTVESMPSATNTRPEPGTRVFDHRSHRTDSGRTFRAVTVTRTWPSASIRTSLRSCNPVTGLGGPDTTAAGAEALLPVNGPYSPEGSGGQLSRRVRLSASSC